MAAHGERDFHGDFQGRRHVSRASQPARAKGIVLRGVCCFLLLLLLLQTSLQQNLGEFNAPRDPPPPSSFSSSSLAACSRSRLAVRCEGYSARESGVLGVQPGFGVSSLSHARGRGSRPSGFHFRRFPFPALEQRIALRFDGRSASSWATSHHSQSAKFAASIQFVRRAPAHDSSVGAALSRRAACAFSSPLFGLCISCARAKEERVS